MSDTSPMVDTGNPQDKADLVGGDNPVESLQEISSFHGPAYSMTDTAKLCTLPHVRKFVLDAFTSPGVAQVTLSETTTNIKPLPGRRNIFTPVPSMLFKPFTPPRGTEVCAAWIPSIPIAEY